MRHECFAISQVRGAYARAASGLNPDDQIRRFMPMIKRLAWHTYGSGRPGIEVEDLIQAGLLALTTCIQRHQGQGENEFAAFARTRVKGAMFDLIRKEAPTTRAAACKKREITAEQDKLTGKLGRLPNDIELAQALGIGTRDLSAMRVFSEPVRFEPIDDSYSESNLAFADDSPNSLAMLEDAEIRTRLANAIGALSERLQLITQLYFIEELNLSEIAEVLEVSVPRVHQLKSQALKQLRESLSGDAILI